MFVNIRSCYVDVRTRERGQPQTPANLNSDRRPEWSRVHLSI